MDKNNYDKLISFSIPSETLSVIYMKNDDGNSYRIGYLYTDRMELIRPMPIDAIEYIEEKRRYFLEIGSLCDIYNK